MIRLAAPGFLVAGALVALAAVALHLLVRSPPERAPLPTARFLSPVRRAAVRLVRRPTDVVLLAVRVLFALALGAAFAGPVWSPPVSSDVTAVVLLDRGVGMAPVWTAAVDSARRIASEASRAALVVFDTSASWIDGTSLRAEDFDSLTSAGTSSAESDYAAAFRALAGPGRETGMRRVVLVTLPRWSSWGDGTSAARGAYPGMVEIVDDWGIGEAGTVETAPTVAGAPRIAAEAGTAQRDAVEALGWTGVDTVVGGERGVIRLRYAATAAPPAWRHEDDPSAVAAGVPGVVFFGGWAASMPRAGRLVPGIGESATGASGATDTIPGATIPARAVAAWRDGSIAAVAGREGEDCVVTTAFALDTGILVLDPSYPELVRHLVSACVTGRAIGGALDSGALAVLVGTGPAETALTETPTARSLAGPLLFLALLLAAAEWPLRNRRRVQES
jgi:hypothetical protein